MKTAFLMATLGDPGWDRFVPSLVDQTQPADRIVVVIDRPTDPAQQTAMRAAWPSVTFLFNDANRGITASLNRGLEAMDGIDLVFRADDDDESRPERLARQFACFEATGADFVTTWGEGRTEGSANGYLIECPTSHDAIVAALARRNVLLHPSLAFRRERILALGGYDETFVNAQDYALYLAGLRRGYRFAAVGEPLVVRHYHAGNISVSRRMNQLMYSCGARVVHHAHTGDRGAFLKTLVQYGILAAIPPGLRALRRRIFAILGRGA